jgi:hypothetical protein
LHSTYNVELEDNWELQIGKDLEGCCCATYKELRTEEIHGRIFFRTRSLQDENHTWDFFNMN